jgi:hypothetical protein
MSSRRLEASRCRTVAKKAVLPVGSGSAPGRNVDMDWAVSRCQMDSSNGMGWRCSETVISRRRVRAGLMNLPSALAT